MIRRSCAVLGASLLLATLTPTARARMNVTTVATQAQSEMGVSSFDPGLGSLVALAFDHQANNLFIYPEHGAEILEYTTSGSPVGSGIPPPGTSNDIDMDFAVEDLSVGGESVSEDTLLVSNGENGNKLFALDKDTGSVEAEQPFNTGTVTGGAQHPTRDSFFILSFGQQVIIEIDSDDGSELNRFPVQPEGSPQFRTNYSDIDVNNETGNIILVSDLQNSIRHLSPTGEWLGDLDVFNDDDASHPLRIDLMTGLAIDDATKDVWISTRRGSVWRLTNAWDHFSTAIPCESDPNAFCGDDEDNTIQGTSEDDTIYAGGGDDVIDGGGGNDVIIGGAGNDVLAGGGQNDRLNGGPGNDIVSGDASTAGSPSALGRAAFISLLQEESPPGKDVLQGGGGEDTVLGGGGADKVLGQAGNDDLAGDAGPDLLKGGGGVNNFDGGPGKDKCVLENRKDKTESCEKKARSFARSFWPTRLPR
ncbi:MAG TPA: hypothetical protein VE174_02445 [Actinomycetota bacterium]|nr:hypothetical protein [Actinomycetota bacterium]